MATSLLLLATACWSSVVLAGAPPATAESTPSVRPAPPVLDAEQLARLQKYKAQRLVIREETELRGGTSALVVAPPGPGPSAAGMVVDPFFTVQTWGVYRGSERLSPATFLRDTGETFRADDVDERVDRDRRKARRWMMVAGVGAASLAAGMVQHDRATTLPEKVLAQQLSLGGTAVGLTGLVSASFPANRATRLATHPGAVMDRPAAEARVKQHNATLARELGLRAEDLLLLELAEGL